MIKKVIEIKKDIEVNDEVELSWFDMNKPNLCAVSKDGVEFILKINAKHLHENDILVCEDGYAIKVIKAKDEIFILSFEKPLLFAKSAYEIGNRHQPIMIEEQKITVLNDIALGDIIEILQQTSGVKVEKTLGYFRSNAKAHHTH